MIYHIVCGETAAAPLHEAIASVDSMAGDIIVLHDDLQAGPLLRAEGQSFKNMRAEWWQEMAPSVDPERPSEDMNRLVALSNAMHQSASATAWFWLAPRAADEIAFAWSLSVLGKHVGRISVLNLANLPFLDESGKVFYPASIAELLPRELIKARRLARLVTPSELDAAQESWERLVADNGTLRTLTGSRKLLSQAADFYDEALVSCISARPQKASRIIQQAVSKGKLPLGEHFLAWRLRQLGAQDRVCLSGDVSRPCKEWEVSLPGSAETALPTAPPVAE